MKRTVTLSMLIACAAICSCQKQDSAAEQQLTRPKVELDGCEQAFAERVSGLEERMNELDKRVSALAEREIRNAETTPSAAQSQVVVREPAQAEVDSEIQQTPTDAQALGPSNVDLEKDREQQRLAQARRGLDKESNRRRKLEQTQKWMMSQATPSPSVDATSSNPSPTSP